MASKFMESFRVPLKPHLFDVEFYEISGLKEIKTLSYCVSNVSMPTLKINVIDDMHFGGYKLCLPMISGAERTLKIEFEENDDLSVYTVLYPYLQASGVTNLRNTSGQLKIIVHIRNQYGSVIDDENGSTLTFRATLIGLTPPSFSRTGSVGAVKTTAEWFVRPFAQGSSSGLKIEGDVGWKSIKPEDEEKLHSSVAAAPSDVNYDLLVKAIMASEGYRDFVYVNWLKPTETRQAKFDIGTIGYGFTLKYALSGVSITLKEVGTGSTMTGTGSTLAAYFESNAINIADSNGFKHNIDGTQTGRGETWVIVGNYGGKSKEETLKDIVKGSYTQTAKNYANGAGLTWESLSGKEKSLIIDGTYNGNTGKLFAQFIKECRTNNIDPWDNNGKSKLQSIKNNDTWHGTTAAKNSITRYENVKTNYTTTE